MTYASPDLQDGTPAVPPSPARSSPAPRSAPRRPHSPGTGACRSARSTSAARRPTRSASRSRPRAYGAADVDAAAGVRLHGRALGGEARAGQSLQRWPARPARPARSPAPAPRPTEALLHRRSDAAGENAAAAAGDARLARASASRRRPRPRATARRPRARSRNTASGAAWPRVAGRRTGARGRRRRRPRAAARRRDDAALPARHASRSADRGPWTVTCTFTNTYRARVQGPQATSSRRSTTRSAWTSPSNGADVDTSAGGRVVRRRRRERLDRRRRRVGRRARRAAARPAR